MEEEKHINSPDILENPIHVLCVSGGVYTLLPIGQILICPTSRSHGTCYRTCWPQLCEVFGGQVALECMCAFEESGLLMAHYK